MLGRSTVLPCSSPSTSFAAPTIFRQPRRLAAPKHVQAALVTDTPRSKAVESNGSRNGDGKVGEGGPTIINGQVRPASPAQDSLFCSIAPYSAADYYRKAVAFTVRQGAALSQTHCTGAMPACIASLGRSLRNIEPESALHRCCTALARISLTCSTQWRAI